MTTTDEALPSGGRNPDTAGTAVPGQEMLAAWQTLAPLMDLATPMAMRVAATLRLASHFREKVAWMISQCSTQRKAGT